MLSSNVLASLYYRRCRSAERKVKSLRARIEKLDVELSIRDRARLSDELVKPLFDNRAVARAVDIKSVSAARWLSIDPHAKSHGGSSRWRPHDKIEVACVEAERNSPSGLIQRDGLLADGPIASKCPVV
jgi:hypothetical protein